MADAPTPDELCEQAKAHVKNKEFKEAAACYERAMALDKRHIGAHEGLASLSFRLQDYPKAVELFKRASQLNPKRVDPLVNMGAVQNRQEKYADAVRTLRQALTKDRKCVLAYYNLGIAYRGQSQDSMAVSAYKEAIRLDPEMVDAYFNLAKTLLEMGNVSQAILNFEKCLQLNPKFEKARHALDKARDQKVQAKKSVSPFGRLVNEKELGSRVADSVLRDLSAQERFDDRNIVHKLSKEAEQAAAAVLEQVREELEQAVLGLSRQVTNEDPDPYSFGKAVEGFNEAASRFKELDGAVRAKMDDLRAHERQIRG